MFSQMCNVCGSFSLYCGIEVHGQASPRGVLSILVRVSGQMGDKPSMRTDHKVGTVTIEMLETWVAGCARR